MFWQLNICAFSPSTIWSFFPPTGQLSAIAQQLPTGRTAARGTSQGIISILGKMPPILFSMQSEVYIHGHWHWHQYQDDTRLCDVMIAMYMHANMHLYKKKKQEFGFNLVCVFWHLHSIKYKLRADIQDIWPHILAELVVFKLNLCVCFMPQTWLLSTGHIFSIGLKSELVISLMLACFSFNACLGS